MKLKLGDIMSNQNTNLEASRRSYTNMIEGKTGIISDRLYNFIIGGCILWGFFFNAIIVATMTEWALSLNMWVLLIGYIVSCVVGISIYNKSHNAWVSFVGYNFIVLPIGVILTYILYDVDPGIIFQAIATTGSVTLLMMVISSIFPRAFMKMGRTLFISLLCVFVVELLMIVIFRVHPAIFDWAIALIFCGYIGYDWAHANNLEKTADNAVDSAARLYVDIINLFIRIVSIMKNR